MPGMHDRFFGGHGGLVVALRAESHNGGLALASLNICRITGAVVSRGSRGEELVEGELRGGCHEEQQQHRNWGGERGGGAAVGALRDLQQ